MKNQPDVHLDSLTGLRFFAAALVVVFHFSRQWHPLLKNFVERGAFGVTIFFVLSGFILSYAYAFGPGVMRGSLRSFWAARFARLYPTYFLGMVFMAPIILLESSAPGWQRLASAGLSIVALQGWFHALGTSWGMWNPPGWSLSAEAFFYLLFPAACMALSRLSAKRLAVVAVASWILSILGMFTNLAISFGKGDYWEFVPLVRFPEFLMGMAAGLIWKNRKTDRFDRLAPVITISSALLMIGMMCLPIRVSVFFSGALSPLVALFICALACGRGLLASVLSWKPFVFLGGASYSLYILHWPAWRIWKRLFGGSWLESQQPHIEFAVYFIVTTCAACLCFKYFEEPLNLFLRRKLMASPPRAAQGEVGIVQSGALSG